MSKCQKRVKLATWQKYGTEFELNMQHIKLLFFLGFPPHGSLKRLQQTIQWPALVKSIICARTHIDRHESHSDRKLLSNRQTGHRRSGWVDRRWGLLCNCCLWLLYNQHVHKNLTSLTYIHTHTKMYRATHIHKGWWTQTNTDLLKEHLRTLRKHTQRGTCVMMSVSAPRLYKHLCVRQCLRGMSMLGFSASLLLFSRVYTFLWLFFKWQQQEKATQVNRLPDKQINKSIDNKTDWRIKVSSPARDFTYQSQGQELWI